MWSIFTQNESFSNMIRPLKISLHKSVSRSISQYLNRLKTQIRWIGIESVNKRAKEIKSCYIHILEERCTNERVLPSKIICGRQRRIKEGGEEFISQFDCLQSCRTAGISTHITYVLIVSMFNICSVKYLRVNIELCHSNMPIIFKGKMSIIFGDHIW